MNRMAYLLNISLLSISIFLYSCSIFIKMVLSLVKFILLCLHFGQLSKYINDICPQWSQIYASLYSISFCIYPFSIDVVDHTQHIQNVLDPLLRILNIVSQFLKVLFFYHIVVCFYKFFSIARKETNREGKSARWIKQLS